MANNEGPRRAALVGNPIYPKVDGRTNHLAPIPIGMGIAAGARAILPALVRYGKPLLQGAKRIFGKTTPASVTKGTKFNKAQSIKEFGKGSGRATGVTMNPSKFNPNYLGSDPIIRSVGAIGKGIFNPTSKGVVAKAARFATAPSSIVAGIAYYMWPDGEERKTPPPGKDQKRGTSGAPGGGDPDMYLTPEGEQPKELTLAEREALEAEARMKKMDKYKEIMDIKGMNKDAAYKSLIDASKIIQEGGNLKEQLKDGSLITKITAAASKRFDKVGDTEAALRSLVAKGEIENEMNKETKALDKEYKQSALDINKKKLAGSTLGEELSAYRTKNNKNASGKTLAGFVMDEGGSIVSIADSSAVDKHIKSGGDSVSFMELVVANNVKAGKEIIPGMYVVKDSLITINPDGSVTPNYKIT
jgi:hypothetical protein